MLERGLVEDAGAERLWARAAFAEAGLAALRALGRGPPLPAAGALPTSAAGTRAHGRKVRRRIAATITRAAVPMSIDAVAPDDVAEGAGGRREQFEVGGWQGSIRQPS